MKSCQVIIDELSHYTSRVTLSSQERPELDLSLTSLLLLYTSQGQLGGGGGAAAQIPSNIRPTPLTQHLNLRLQLSHHIEDGHHQYQGGGRHGEDQSQPGIVGDDYAGGSGEPGERAEEAFSPLLRMQKREGDE